MIAYLLLRLKWWIADEELCKLERYRQATQEAERWLCPYSDPAAQTAEWIRNRGEGTENRSIATFRQELFHDRMGKENKRG